MSAPVKSVRARIGAALRERLALSAPARRLRLAEAEEVLARHVGDLPVRMLDAGCGDGLLALALAERHPHWNLIGVDLRDELLRGALTRARNRGLTNVRFERADLTESLPAGRFDVVLAIECLEEITDDEGALRIMSAALAPGGILVGQVPEGSWRAVLPGSPSTWRDQVRQGYSAAEITAALTLAGLEVVCVRPTFRGTVSVAQELADRIKGNPPLVRALCFPPMAAAVRLERAGLTWGRERALLAVARKPSGG